MVRMLGTWSKPWCPACKLPAGPDCPDVSVTKKVRRAQEKQEFKREIRFLSRQRPE